MPFIRRDESLRELVADLALQSEQDIEAVLAELTPERRRKVEPLLHDHRDIATLSVPASASPWLAQYLSLARREARMTPIAFKTLEECFRNTGRVPVGSSVPPKSLMARVFAPLFGRQGNGE